MAEATHKSFVTYPWLFSTAVACCAIMVTVIGLFLLDLRGRLDDIKKEFPKKLDITTYTEHLTRTAAIEAHLANKVNIDLFNALCSTINRMEANQIAIMQDQKELMKTQQRVVQKLGIQ